MIIQAGHHSLDLITRLCNTGIWLGKPKWRYRVTFIDSCRYILDGEDAEDINKLGGFAYGFGNHINSARFGWRYCMSRQNIELFAYVYRNKKPTHDFIQSVHIGETVTLEIKPCSTTWEFYANFNKRLALVVPQGLPTYGTYQTLYFGGNQVAPQDIEVLIHPG